MLNKFTLQSRDVKFFITRAPSSSSRTISPCPYSAKSRSTHASLSLFQHKFFLSISHYHASFPPYISDGSFIRYIFFTSPLLKYDTAPQNRVHKSKNKFQVDINQIMSFRKGRSMPWGQGLYFTHIRGQPYLRDIIGYHSGGYAYDGRCRRKKNKLH